MRTHRSKLAAVIEQLRERLEPSPQRRARDALRFLALSSAIARGGLDPTARERFGCELDQIRRRTPPLSSEEKEEAERLSALAMKRIGDALAGGCSAGRERIEPQ